MGNYFERDVRLRNLVASFPAMHPALEKLTLREALDLFRAPMLMQQWIDRAGVPFREATNVIFDRAMEAMDADPPPNPRRRDTKQLLEFVDKAEGLPFRLRQVARLCLEEGLSLSECAAHLGITRETGRFQDSCREKFDHAAVRS